MMNDAVDTIARTVLYEGARLYPYRESSLKNRRCVLFGTLLPRAWIEAHRTQPDDADAFDARTECLLHAANEALLESTRISITVRFLDTVLAEEHAVTIDDLTINEHEHETERPIAIDRFAGRISVRTERLDPRTARVRVIIENHSPIAFGDLLLDSSLRSSIVDDPIATTPDRAHAEALGLGAAHVVLRVAGTMGGGARWISLVDPPVDLEAHAKSCTQKGLWPVLVAATNQVMLASPIILSDHPTIAPESQAGDLFDATEIEEILALRILTLTDEEKREARENPVTRELLTRVEALTPAALSRLHGVLRQTTDFVIDERSEESRSRSPKAIGDRVTIHPRGQKGGRGSDAFDVLLRGMDATIAAIETTDLGERMFSVTIDRDPGRDLGAQGFPGHRFFFREDELQKNEPTTTKTQTAPPPRILVAGIGNILMGDDGFGVEVIRRLAATYRRANVKVVDFGIRGFDLALALSSGDVDVAILVDASARGHVPGTITVLEPHDVDGAEATRLEETHGMHPLRALALARQMGSAPQTIRLVLCEPDVIGTEDDPIMGLSKSIEDAVPTALRMLHDLIEGATTSNA